MDSQVDRYLKAGTRDNTRRSYQSAIEHFEVTWGGFLPATSNSIARYLAQYAGVLSINTLKQRLAALAQWHISQGFPDPTKSPLVKQVIKGIRASHPVQTKQAKPLPIQHLEHMVQWMRQEIYSTSKPEEAKVLRRDIALLLIGFWRGFRSDELCRLRIEHIKVDPAQGMQIYLPYSKGDRHNLGTDYYAPALKYLCPVSAYLDWLSCSGLEQGAVFRSINRWGDLGTEALHPASLTGILTRIAQKTGLVEQASYSSHSLRRGFACWANAQGWDIKALMQYVGWKDLKSAMRYINPEGSFGNLALNPKGFSGAESHQINEGKTTKIALNNINTRPS